jgi:hypothetical protein
LPPTTHPGSPGCCANASAQRSETETLAVTDLRHGGAAAPASAGEWVEGYRIAGPNDAARAGRRHAEPRGATRACRVRQAYSACAETDTRDRLRVNLGFRRLSCCNR